MTANSPFPTEVKPPEKQPWGAGPLMIIGLVLALVAAWCAKDYFWPQESWIKENRAGTIGMNGIAMAGFGLGAIYVFVLAFVRSRKGGCGACGGDAPSAGPDAGPPQE